ncbi:MAG: zinc-ribbon domain-containing protein [Chloroflexi bacterium]|nr:zinc-ribbon domain-containing protein [Chloroflexota bacterium]
MDRIIDPGDMADIDDAIQIWKKWKFGKQDVSKREQEIKQDIDRRWALIEQELEKSKLEYLQGKSIETLMAIARDPANLQTLYKTARLRTLESLPRNKAALLMLEDQAITADIAKEIILAVQQSGQMEKYIAELKEMRHAGQASDREHLQALLQTVNSALAGMSAAAGPAVWSPPGPPRPPVRFCVQCGTEVPSGSRFCGHCGSQL